MNSDYRLNGDLLTDANDIVISQSIDIVLNALQSGPIKLSAVVANFMHQNAQLKEKNQNLEKRLQKMEQHEYRKHKPPLSKDVSIQHEEEIRHVNGSNVLSEKRDYKLVKESLSPNYACNKSGSRSSSNASLNLPSPKFEDFNLQKISSSSEVLMEMPALLNEPVPHPLLSCHCDVCHKLLQIPNVETYKLSTRNGALFPPNCVVLVKGDLLATVSYVGHRREYAGFVSERLCRVGRSVGVTLYVWQLGNEEAFVSFEDIEYAFDGTLGGARSPGGGGPEHPLVREAPPGHDVIRPDCDRRTVFSPAPAYLRDLEAFPPTRSPLHWQPPQRLPPHTFLRGGLQHGAQHCGQTNGQNCTCNLHRCGEGDLYSSYRATREDCWAHRPRPGSPAAPPYHSPHYSPLSRRLSGSDMFDSGFGPDSPREGYYERRRRSYPVTERSPSFSHFPGQRFPSFPQYYC